MTTVLRNRNTWIAAAVWGSFWLFAPWMQRDDLFDLMNGIAVSLGVGVLIAYAPGAWRSLHLEQEKMTGGHYLVLGVMTVCGAFTAHRAWQWAWRWAGEPKWMSSHLVVAWLIWIIASGYMVHLTSIGAIDGRVPGRNIARLAGYVVIGLVLAVFAIVMFA